MALKSELNPLLRLLHNDRQKLAKVTNGDPTIKVSNPAMLAKIKISQLNTNLEDLPIMQTHVLTKLLAMTACTQIDYSRAGSKADAWHIAHFLKFEKDGATLREFKTIKDFQEFADTAEKCFCAIAMETKRDRAFFRDISAQCVTTSLMRAAKRNWTTFPRIGWRMSSQCCSLSRRSCTRTHSMRRWTSTHSRSSTSKPCISITRRGAANAETPTSRSNVSTHQPKPRRPRHPPQASSEDEEPNRQEGTKKRSARNRSSVRHHRQQQQHNQRCPKKPSRHGAKLPT
jgi:hypothetical protein